MLSLIPNPAGDQTNDDSVDSPRRLLRPDLKTNFSGPPAVPVATGPDGYLQQGSIRMTLEDPDLWKTFHENGTEMIITKPGRLEPHPPHTETPCQRPPHRIMEYMQEITILTQEERNNSNGN